MLLMADSKQAIIFDFGGVLLQWDPHRVYRRFFDEPHQIDQFLTEIDFATWNAEQDRGRPFSEGVAELSSQFPQYAHLIRAYYEHWEDSIAGPIEGSVAILRMLKQSGFPLYGLSNWSAETYPRVRDRYDFFRLFDDIILSGEVGVNKPDPAIFALTLARIARPAGECLLIDDSETNVVAARRMGFSALHFSSPEQLRHELHSLGIL